MAARLAEATGRERLDLLVELAYEYHVADPMRALAYGNEALGLLPEWGSEEHRWKLLPALAWAHMADGSNAAGLRYGREYEALARLRGDRQRLVQSLRVIAANQIGAGDLGPALKTYQDALTISRQLGEYRLGAILVSIAGLYRRLGDLEKGLEYQQLAYRYFEDHDLRRGVAVALANIADTYRILGRFDEAIEFYGRSREILQQQGDQRRGAQATSALAAVYRDSGEPARALEIHRQALTLLEEFGLKPAIASVLREIGTDHQALGELEAAGAAYRRSLSLWEEAGDPVRTAEVLTALGKLERQRGRYQTARRQLERAVALFNQAKVEDDAVQTQEDAALELAETYRSLGRDGDALRAFLRHKELLVDRLEGEKGRNLAAMQVRFDVDLKEKEVDLKEKEIELLEQQQRRQALELERQRTSRQALAAVFGLALLVLALVFNRSRLKTRAAMMQQAVEQERSVSARLRAVDKLKDEFLANTSHELRTPLYGITGIAESLIDGARGELPEPAKADLSMLATSGRRLGQLVNDILDYSRLTHKSLKLRQRPVDLRPLVDVVLVLQRPLAGSKELELRNAVPPDLPAAQADEARLEQILHNLVGNAVKFTEEGYVEVSASAREGWLTLTVEDTGIGIAEDKREQIFEAFEQADSGIQRAFGGTGLGLTVSRELVKLHGGEIRVESTPGEGTRFSFTLPVSDQRAESAAAAERPASRLMSPPAVAAGTDHSAAPTADAVERGPGRRPPERRPPERLPPEHPPPEASSMLVVDDEPVILQVLSNHLVSAGHEVTAVASGAEALSLTQERSFDLVVLDVMMPKMSGYEVCRALRQRHSLEELPVIFLTAKNQVPDLVVGLAAGGNDYLAKPIAKDELLARVRTHLELLSVHRRLAARNAELARFNYTIAHDLKNPLTTIINFLGLVRRDAASGRNERLEHDLDRLDAAAEKLRLLLDELFELSRVGIQANPPEAVAFGELAREALKQLADLITERGVEIEVAEDLPPVLGDRARLFEAVRHLLHNAVQYLGDQPSPRVEISTRKQGAEVVFYVRDNGIGIDPRYHDKVFELFERLDPQTSEGTGIGLALVQRIVEVHGGRVWVESEGRGQGSTLCFTLPRAQS